MKSYNSKSSSICRITCVALSLLLALLVAGNVRIVRDKRLFDDLDEIRTELEELEATFHLESSQVLAIIEE